MTLRSDQMNLSAAERRWLPWFGPSGKLAMGWGGWHLMWSEKVRKLRAMRGALLYALNRQQSASPRVQRYIPQSPERILDAPELLDDYYLNLLDWSSTNVLGVALGDSIYLWNAADGSIQQLMQTQGEQSHVSSLAWIGSGRAAGHADGTADAVLPCRRAQRKIGGTRFTKLVIGTGDGSVGVVAPRGAQLGQLPERGPVHQLPQAWLGGAVRHFGRRRRCQLVDDLPSRACERGEGSAR